MPKELVVERSSQWYSSLVEDCDAIKVEKAKIASQEIAEMYLMLGARILQEAAHGPITKLVEAVSVDIHIGYTNLWYAVAAAKKYGEDVNNIPIDRASVSWTKVKKLLTPPAGEEQPSSFDPYAFVNKLWSRETPDNCRIVGTELLRLWREKSQ